MKIMTTLMVSFIGLVVFGNALPPVKIGQKCEKIDHEMCNDLPYNMTSFPNMVGEENLKDASESISTYKPLLSVVCSEQLKFFLCSVYFPMCNEKLSQPIGPCRPLCLSVQEKCLPILKGFGFSWPDVIRCDKFPLENNREKMCMKGPNEQGTIQDERAKYLDSEMMEDDDDDGNDMRRRLGARKPCGINEVYLNKTERCVPKCSTSQSIARAEQESATLLLISLAYGSVILTFLSLLVVCISRFGCLSSLLDRSVFFSSVAFCITSLAYIISVNYRDSISCTDYTNHFLFVVGGLTHVPCSSIASLIYYSSTCARLWWLLLCCSWNRTTRTANLLGEARTRVQMLIWGLPLAPLIFALLSKSVAANPLTGICLIGAANNTVDWIFNFFRDCSLFFATAFVLIMGCCRLLGTSDSDINGFAGIIATFYPMASLFYMLSFINEASQPTIGWAETFNIVSAIKYTFDLILSFIMCLLCFFYLLSRITRSNSSKVSKEGYQPAIPKLPQPAIPGSIRSNTYASTFRTNMI